jgi:methylglyoxal reductase
MKTMKLGKTDINISRMGLGTWPIGGGPAWNGDRELQSSIDTIRTCPSIGVNVIDTAPGYNFGNSEVIVGKALKGMKREDVCLITKCGLTWKRKGSLFNKVGDVQLYKNLSKESIMEEIEMSLERLETDYIDVYMTHWQSVEPYFTPIKETMEALNELKAAGKIKSIGAANMTPEHIKEYLKYGQLDLVQAKYSILDRAIEQDLVPICRENKITLQAYSPLEQGLLSGCLPRDYVPTGAQCNKKWFQPENMQKAMNMMDSWKDLCKKYDCTIANLSLAWVLAQGDFFNLLSGATTVDQIKENVKSAEVELSKSDAKLMREMAEALDN